jgi:Uri superfamily endonuclease
VEAFVLPGSTTSECELHSQLRGCQVLVPGFGSSDCGCESRLAYFRKRPIIDLMTWKEFIGKKEDTLGQPLARLV